MPAAAVRLIPDGPAVRRHISPQNALFCVNCDQVAALDLPCDGARLVNLSQNGARHHDGEQSQDAEAGDQSPGGARPPGNGAAGRPEFLALAAEPGIEFDGHRVDAATGSRQAMDGQASFPFPFLRGSFGDGEVVSDLFPGSE